MNRGLLLLIAFACGVTLWWTSSRHRSFTPSTEDTVHGAPPAEAGSRLTGVPGDSEIAGSPEDELSTFDAAPEGPVLAMPRTIRLASIEEPPAALDSEIDDTSPSLAPVTVMENLRSAFRQYSSRFGGNPVGDNSEITATLNGQNPWQTVFLAIDDGFHLNENGQLTDNWGTPFFFHQLSRTEMEIHSAGPDRRMWTSDDLVLK